MAKIVIVSGIQIINNPRVVKEATALTQAGYDVEVLGAIFDEKSKKRIENILKNVRWRHIPVIDLTSGTLFTKFIYLMARIRRRVSFLQKKYLNKESPHQLGYFVKRLYRLARGREADLYIVHLEQALWVGNQLLKQGKKVAIDIEDWYSEDCLPDDRALRPVKLIKEYESNLLKNAVYSTTTSRVLSSSLMHAYQCKKPAVVYNSFPNKTIIPKYLTRDRTNQEIPSITWFSQTIGPGRGLEELISALNQVSLPFELHIRGTDSRGFCRELLCDASSKIQKCIYIHPQVAEEELLTRIKEHDIGYCGDLSQCKSRDLTITNKMLEYLRAGLAVVASNTKGHLEAAEIAQGAVMIFDQYDTNSLTKVINSLLSDLGQIAKLKQQSLSSVSSDLGWLRSSEVLTCSVNNSFES